MTRRCLLACACLAVLLTTVTAAGQGKVLLVRKAKVGEVSRISTVGLLTLNVGGQQVTLSIKGVERQTVTEVGEDGRFTIRVEGTPEEILMNGNPMPLPPASPPAIVVRSRNSAVMSSTGGDPSEQALNQRMHNGTAAVFSDQPVGVGDTWSRQIKEDAKTGLMAASAQYKVLAIEKVGVIDAYKLSIVFTEAAADGIRTTGTIWVDPSSGDELKAEIEVRNVPFPGVGPANGTLRQVRLESK